jgi:DNA-binding GntR family transcriptional regulator
VSKSSDHAYRQIRSMILNGELAPGSRIGEVRLSVLCGVSRTPVREALRRLEAEALIRRSGSQRSFVADWSPGDVAHAFELRAILEALAARRAAERIAPAQLDELRACNMTISQAISVIPPNIAGFLDGNRRFHAIIMDAAASPQLATMLAGVIEQPVVLRTAHSYSADNLRRSWREHDELLAALACGDGGWAAAVMTAHIRRAYHAYADLHRPLDEPALADAAE